MIIKSVVKKELVIVILLLFVQISIMPSIKSSGITIYVDDDQTPDWYDSTHVHTIGESLDIAQNGDTIFVYNGIYSENNLIVDTRISIIGENKDDTIIDNTDTQYSTFVVSANDVSISYFSIKSSLTFEIPEKGVRDINGAFPEFRGGSGTGISNSGDSVILSNCIIYGFSYGIYFENAYHCTISDCNVHNCFEAIFLTQSDSNQIQNCEVYSSTFGIDLSYGTDNDVIENCHPHNNFYGIQIDSSYNTHITGCLIENNHDGCTLANSIYSLMRNNQINNCLYGFGVGAALVQKFDNDIDTSNTINGKPIYYLTEESDLTIDETMEIGYLQLYDCTNILIKNRYFSDNIFGLILAKSQECTIQNCNFENNENVNIVLTNSNTNDRGF